ncbi:MULTISPECIES: hypothetical protein [Paraburkholderia]|uniref:Uncharacterized protein n=1 Tax=Paraburkholderia madseniana TaxID=2599607 RepID=A0AAP5BL85_9BURK|nr:MULTISPECIES: hypothetical protein [Paraburkholderia]MCX4151102.1 hypothetical protein [Paraburkholderia madseniana]MDN7154034.1 hypothetical protein [Paraburkholderia sp. WS6]MDQ6412916.1 hypothetical protein [Paraburkholderia madseniana]
MNADLKHIRAVLIETVDSKKVNAGTKEEFAWGMRRVVGQLSVLTCTNGLQVASVFAVGHAVDNRVGIRGSPQRPNRKRHARLFLVCRGY